MIQERDPSKKKCQKRKIYSSPDLSTTSVSDILSFHDDSSTDESILEISFQEILPTPEIKKKMVQPRAKSLNYRAVTVSKALFTEKNKNQDKKHISDKGKQMKPKKRRIKYKTKIPQ
uniref:Uncharacterized protein LOC114334296 n=1 Tax=Diabrotica virgifera virgifera TaxID=50390 RepID=A0A6P7FUK9_DIAVI